MTFAYRIKQLLDRGVYSGPLASINAVRLKVRQLRAAEMSQGKSFLTYENILLRGLSGNFKQI